MLALALADWPNFLFATTEFHRTAHAAWTLRGGRPYLVEFEWTLYRLVKYLIAGSSIILAICLGMVFCLELPRLGRSTLLSRQTREGRAMLFVLLGLVILWFINQLVAHPIKRIHQKLLELERDEPGQPLEMHAAAELTRLGSSVNALGEVLELKQRTGLDGAFLQALLEREAQAGLLALESGGLVRPRGRAVELSPEERARRESLLGALEQAAFQPPTPAELSRALGCAESHRARGARRQSGNLDRLEIAAWYPLRRLLKKLPPRPFASGSRILFRR